MKIYMKIVSLILITLCSTSVFAQSELEGIWDTGQEHTKIEISEHNGRLEGVIRSSDNEKAKIGKVILKDLGQQDTQWTGQIWAARRQKWFDVVITPSEDILELEIDARIRRKTVEWKRLQ